MAVEITSPLPGATVATLTTVEGTGPAGSNIWVQEDSITLGVAPVTAGGFVVTLDVPLEPGEHSLHVFAVDSEGVASPEVIVAVTVGSSKRGPTPPLRIQQGRPAFMGETVNGVPYGDQLVIERESFFQRRYFMPTAWKNALRSATRRALGRG